MATTQNVTGYGPRRRLVFDGDQSKYELWEVKFLGYTRLQKLYKVFVPDEEEEEAPDREKNADAFAELIQCLDDRSLSLIIREAKDDGRKALQVLREHYQGKGKPRIISLYTELTSLKKQESETTTDYIIRAETTATALKAAEEVISDGLLIAMVLKGLPLSYKTFATVIIQREKQLTFAEFKVTLRSYEENEKAGTHYVEERDNVMVTRQKFDGKCFNCGKKGHKSTDCWKKSEKWCTNCRSKTHLTKDCRNNKDAVKTVLHEVPDEKCELKTFTFTVKDNNDYEHDKSSSKLMVDSGATSHIINDKSKFVNFDKNFNPSDHTIELADGSRASVALGKGNAKVKLYNVNGKERDIILNNALYIPTYEHNIFSVHAAVQDGAAISFSDDVKQYVSASGDLFNIEQKGRLYYLNSISSSKNNASSLREWHKILGHCNYNDVRRLENVVEGMVIKDDTELECEVCTQGKMCEVRNRKPDTRAKGPLEFVHCDLAGPINPISRKGYKYALCFVDDFTDIKTVYFLKHKNDTVQALENFLADIAPFGKVKRIRSDNGTEFTNRSFKSLLLKNGIKHELSAPYSPHQNGTVERSWRTLFSMARCLLLEGNVPKSLWPQAVMTAAYIRNRCFNSRLVKTPYEALTRTKPNLCNMHVFGAKCYAYQQNAKKLDPRSQKGIFVGYDRDSPAYLVYFPEVNTISKVRCVKFFDRSESETRVQHDHDDGYLSDTQPLASVETNKVSQLGEESNVVEQDVSTRYPTRTHNIPQYYEYGDRDTDDNANRTVDYCYGIENVPTFYSEAVKSVDSSKWQQAMEDEMKALYDNETYELVPPPKGRKIVGGRWVYAVKCGPNGEETFKARYVAKGYSQVHGVDYHETFAPTARMSSVRMLLQRVVQYDMTIHQMDVKTAYLNAPIDCDIYMQQPEGFTQLGSNGESLVCKLKKSLYGLKQSGRNWNNLLHNYLIKEQFVQSLADSCLYVKHIDVECCVIVIIWVDDIIIAAKNVELVTSVKTSLSKVFKMKDLGEINWFLGIKFECRKGCIEMNQTRYIEKILSKFEMTDCKSKATPCILGNDKVVDTDSSELDDPSSYRAMVGSLIYLMTGTRPDLCYIVTRLSQKMSKPTNTDLIKAKHVLRFLKGTAHWSLKFKRSEIPLKLSGFCDADWGASIEDRRSITGYNFQLSEEGPMISWKSRKQQTVALSSCEAEYMALANAVQEARFLRQLCIDMGICVTDKNVIMHIDNQGAMNLAKSPVNHQRSKHIDIKYHFIRSEINSGIISLEYTPTDMNVADIFTKPMTKVKLDKFSKIIFGN